MDIALTPKQRDVLIVLYGAHPRPGTSGGPGDKQSFVSLEKKKLLNIDSRKGGWEVSLTPLGLDVAAALADKKKAKPPTTPPTPRRVTKQVTRTQRPKKARIKLAERKRLIEQAFKNIGRKNLLLTEAEAGILAMAAFYDNAQHRPEVEKHTGARTKIPSKGPEAPDVSQFNARQRKALQGLKRLGLVEVDRMIRRTAKGYSRPIPGTSTVRITPIGRVYVRYYLPQQYREGTSFDIPFTKRPGPAARPKKVRKARKRW